MRIVETYSHLNGFEYLMYHKPNIWAEIVEAIESVNAEQCRTKVSKEKKIEGKLLYSPQDMNKAMQKKFIELNWHKDRVSYWVTGDANLIRKTIHLPPDEQKEELKKQKEEQKEEYKAER